jgi:hypothetical protein
MRGARVPRTLVDLAVGLGAGQGQHLDRGLALEGVRLVGVAVVAVDGPVEADGAGRAQGQQEEDGVVSMMSSSVR